MDKEFFKWYFMQIKRLPLFLLKRIPKYWAIILINIIAWTTFIYYYNQKETILIIVSFVVIFGVNVPYFYYKISKSI